MIRELAKIFDMPQYHMLGYHVLNPIIPTSETFSKKFHSSELSPQISLYLIELVLVLGMVPSN